MAAVVVGGSREFLLWEVGLVRGSVGGASLVLAHVTERESAAVENGTVRLIFDGVRSFNGRIGGIGERRVRISYCT